MFRLRQVGDVACVLLLVFIASNVHARSIDQNHVGDDFASGVLIDRLSYRHQKIWWAIRQIIYSEDADGNALHPRLRGLFEQLHTSGHSIHLEFDESHTGCHCKVGEFLLEKLDPEGSRNVAVIKLYLSNIDNAPSPLLANPKDNFVPFAGLNKLDRYVEVLGHEMGHAADILFTPDLANLVDEVLKESDYAIQERLSRKGRLEPEFEQKLLERDAFLTELEKPARIAEAMIWRELVGSRKKRKA
jgi:hypothetical protein